MTITIYEAKKIVTMNPARPVATHVAVRDGRILGAGALDAAPRGEQRESAAARAGDEVGELVHRSSVGAVAAGRRHGACDVQDPLSRIVERRSDIEARPRRGR